MKSKSRFARIATLSLIRWTYAVAAMAAVCFANGSVAATLKSIVTKDGYVLISISGEIVEGDADALETAIKAANDSGKFVSGVRLNSVGGNLVEGVKLSELVKFAKTATNVAQGATCASACFLIFAAGETKFANYAAQVGVHGASDQTGSETVRSEAATVSMARVAKELGVPASIIGRMVVTPPSEMVWLSPSDLQSMGTTMVGRPSQIPALPQARNIQQVPADDPTSMDGASAQGSIDRLQLVDAEQRRCQRFFLSTPSKAQLLETLNVSISSECECVAPIFVSRLLDDEIIAMYSGRSFPTEKFFPIVQQCASRLMR